MRKFFGFFTILLGLVIIGLCLPAYDHMLEAARIEGGLFASTVYTMWLAITGAGLVLIGVRVWKR